MAKYYIKSGTLELIFSTERSLMMLAVELSTNAIPMMNLMSICILMSVGTGTILLLTQPRL
jgi:hypothetical protein